MYLLIITTRARDRQKTGGTDDCLTATAFHTATDWRPVCVELIITYKQQLCSRGIRNYRMAVTPCAHWEVQRIVGRGGSGPLQEPDLVLPVGRRGVGVSGHDEGVADADGRAVQSLGQAVDLVDDGQLVSGARERPESHDTGETGSKPVQIIPTRSSVSHVYRSTLTVEVCGIQIIIFINSFNKCNFYLSTRSQNRFYNIWEFKKSYF